MTINVNTEINVISDPKLNDSRACRVEWDNGLITWNIEERYKEVIDIIDSTIEKGVFYGRNR